MLELDGRQKFMVLWERERCYLDKGSQNKNFGFPLASWRTVIELEARAHNFLNIGRKWNLVDWEYCYQLLLLAITTCLSFQKVKQTFP